jgi:hypothetical protein
MAAKVFSKHQPALFKKREEKDEKQEEQDYKDFLRFLAEDNIAEDLLHIENMDNGSSPKRKSVPSRTLIIRCFDLFFKLELLEIVRR